jgi:hypothetical protein
MLIQLAIIGGIIYAIARAVRGRGERDRVDPGGAISIRRLFQYALLLAALVVAASGVSGVLSQVISDAAARRSTQLAGPLALTVTGVPVFWLLGRWIWHQLQTDTAERESVGWSLYINVALIGSLIIAVSMAFAIAERYINGDGYDGNLLAPLLVAVAVWLGHWAAWRRIPPAVLVDLPVMAGAAIGLGSMAGGAGFVIGLAIERVFQQARGVDASRLFGNNLSMALVAISIGIVVWVWHWLYNGLDAERTTLWHGYVILIGILGGLLAAVIGGTTALFFILQWMFGDPEATSAAAHFQDASPAVAAGIVGIATWFYHRTVLGFDRTEVRTDIDRIYDYLVSGVALATVAGALTTLIVALFSAFDREDVISDGGSDLNIVIAAVTLLLVGAPLWAVAWRRAQQAMAATPEEESASSARRIYLFAVFGIGGAVAFGALTRFVFVLFESVLGERPGGALIEDIRIPVALLATTGAVAAYHWSVYRAERNIAEPTVRRDVTLVWAGGDPGEIEERANVRINTVRRLDAGTTTPATDDIVIAIDQADGDRLMVIAGSNGVDAIPVESR